MILVAFRLLLLILCNTDLLARSELLEGAQRITNLSDNVPCRYDFCHRCVDRNIRDAKKCIYVELDQEKPDGLTWRPTGPASFPDGNLLTTGPNKVIDDNLAGAVFIVNERRYYFAVNIDSCRRVSSVTRIGPLFVGGQRKDNVTIGQIVDQLFSLPAKAAVQLVLSNARQGRDRVQTYFDGIETIQSAQNISLYEELEDSLKNASIKWVSNVVFQVGGGTGAWIATTAFLNHQLQSAQQPPSEALEKGAIATMVLLTYLATIQFLEDVVEKPLLVATIDWVLWIIGIVVGRMWQLIEDLGPLPRLHIDVQEIIRAFLGSIGTGQISIRPNPQLRIANEGTALGDPQVQPGVCDQP